MNFTLSDLLPLLMSRAPDVNCIDGLGANMLEVFVVYIEHILLKDSTRGTWEAGLGPSCLPQNFFSCFGFRGWPSWQHFTDGNRIQGTDPACLLSPIFTFTQSSLQFGAHIRNPDLILKAAVCVRAQDRCHLCMAEGHLWWTYNTGWMWMMQGRILWQHCCMCVNTLKQVASMVAQQVVMPQWVLSFSHL